MDVPRDSDSITHLTTSPPKSDTGPLTAKPLNGSDNRTWLSLFYK